MREPTEAEVEAFKAAWEAEDVRAHTNPRGFDRKPGDRTRAGLRAVFALMPPQPGPFSDSGWSEVAAAIIRHAYQPPSGPWYAVVPPPCKVCGFGPNDARHSIIVNSDQRRPAGNPLDDLVTDPRVGTWHRHEFFQSPGGYGLMFDACDTCGLSRNHEVHRTKES